MSRLANSSISGITPRGSKPNVISQRGLQSGSDEKKIVHESESLYIPIGTVHRLANPGKIPLELIEVQVGSYLGEDDIVRLDDVYGRG